MVREADVNGDGKISKEEFVGLLHQTSVPDSLDQYDSRLESNRIDPRLERPED